jgi:ABC-type phosphate transport system substrate-binding protein
MKTINTVLAMLVLSATVTLNAAEKAYKLIAHPSVPVQTLAKDDVSLLFLKKVTTYSKWGNAGLKVVPFDLAQASDTRAKFSTDVHGKATATIKSHWQQQIFSGRGTPPVEYLTDAEVIAAVAKTSGGIGYVAADASLPQGVHVIAVK